MRATEIVKYREAYRIALQTLTEVLLNENESVEDRIEAAEVILMNEPRNDRREPVK